MKTKGLLQIKETLTKGKFMNCFTCKNKWKQEWNKTVGGAFSSQNVTDLGLIKIITLQ